MEYTKKYSELITVFNPDIREIRIPDSDIRIVNTDFISDYMSDGFFNKSDTYIKENFIFSYPVFVPKEKDSKKTIILLHGLNERSWVKYLVWAFYLAENTGSYVVLFPMSFHINRSPESWRDPRAMLQFMKERKSSQGEITMSSFANIALSNRLTEDPKRFLNSGYQTVCDLENLSISIKEGKHPVIPEGSRINIFAYSIGAFLAQIIMMGNPQNLFSDSKLFMFCGGSVFSSMHGESKLIMDSMAYEKLYKYYLDDFEEEIKCKNSFMDYILSGKIGIAFRSMIDLGRFKKFRENTLAGLKDQICSIGLSKDTVIPAKEIIRALKNSSEKITIPAKTWDFPYSYSHENPFPVFNTSLSLKVDRSFEQLFTAASLFLA